MNAGMSCGLCYTLKVYGRAYVEMIVESRSIRDMNSTVTIINIW